MAPAPSSWVRSLCICAVRENDLPPQHSFAFLLHFSWPGGFFYLPPPASCTPATRIVPDGDTSSLPTLAFADGDTLAQAGPGRTASIAEDLTVLLSTALPSGELLHVTPGSHALRDDCTPKRYSGSCTTRTHGLNAALSHALTTFSSCTPAQDSVQSVAQTLVSLTHSSHNSCNDIVVVTEFIT